MSLPHASEARPYYQAAKQRFEDARFLLEAERTTGAMYLAGYSVECMLKALILTATSKQRRKQELESFRGSKAHSFDWLRGRYFDCGGRPFPSDIAKGFALVNTWEVDIRYQARSVKRGDAEAFLHAAETVMTWADGRL